VNHFFKFGRREDRCTINVNMDLKHQDIYTSVFILNIELHMIDLIVES
jgi:hypothetical protein